MKRIAGAVVIFLLVLTFVVVMRWRQRINAKTELIDCLHSGRPIQIERIDFAGQRRQAHLVDGTALAYIGHRLRKAPDDNDLNGVYPFDARMLCAHSYVDVVVQPYSNCVGMRLGVDEAAPHQDLTYYKVTFDSNAPKALCDLMRFLESPTREGDRAF